MSNVTLPQFPDIAPTDDWDSVIECVNSYAEEYAAARVRDALEEAAKELERRRNLLINQNVVLDIKEGVAMYDLCAGAIRALIPQAVTTKEI